MKDALPTLGADVRMVSLDVDSTESADQLARYADRHGFSWRFAIPSAAHLRELERAFGTSFLVPPAEPMFMVGPRLVARAVPGPRRNAATLRRIVDERRAAD